MKIKFTWKCESSSERVLGQPGHRNVHRDVTLTGGFRVMCEMRKFMARSSQFMKESTVSLMTAGMTWV